MYDSSSLGLGLNKEGVNDNFVIKGEILTWTGF